MKKRIIALLLVLLIMFSLTGCFEASVDEGDTAAAECSNFAFIEDSNALAYNKDTKVIYYMYSTSRTGGYQGYGYSYFAPYISENGNFCRYVNGEITEIIK